MSRRLTRFVRALPITIAVIAVGITAPAAAGTAAIATAAAAAGADSEAVAVARAASRPGLKTRNVVLIVCDGLRWQEVFTGAEDALINEKNGGIWVPEAELRRRFWDPDPQRRRRLLMPFLWTTVAAQGQLLGNLQEGSSVHIANPYAFSYPGYNEMASGIPDPRVNSNELGPNPNVTVFEWLSHRPALAGKVDVFGTWTAFHDIFNERRSHLTVRSGVALVDTTDTSARGRLLQELVRTTPQVEPGDPPDSFLNVALRDHLAKHRPRVLFVGYGDTDNWAHTGRYDLVLEAAHSFDAYVGQLWQQMQALPEYRNQTTFVITADHGRGTGPVDWKEHGVEQKGSENIWLAIIGPDTAPRGERAHTRPVIQAEIAATVAALVGENYRDAMPQAAPDLLDVLDSP